MSSEYEFKIIYDEYYQWIFLYLTRIVVPNDAEDITQDVQKMGVQCLESEQAFNEIVGIGTEQCDVPKFMCTEPLPPHNTVFDKSKNEMRKIWSIKPIKNQFWESG